MSADLRCPRGHHAKKTEHGAYCPEPGCGWRSRDKHVAVERYEGRDPKIALMVYRQWFHEPLSLGGGPTEHMLTVEHARRLRDELTAALVELGVGDVD